jgi:prevent-host-death family protein
MEIHNIHETKTHLSKLLEKVMAGEKIIIAKSGKPVAEIVPYQTKVQPRKPGFWQGRIKISDDFDETPAEIIRQFQGEQE